MILVSTDKIFELSMLKVSIKKAPIVGLKMELVVELYLMDQF